MWTPRDLAFELDPLIQQIKGAVRRLAITLTSNPLWQLAGFRNSDGTTETRQAEVFSGIGFFSRPPSSGKPEAIATMVGGDARVPVVVATRDEATRQAVLRNLGLPPPAHGIGGGGLPAPTDPALNPDESIMFTSQAYVYITSAGAVRIQLVGGSPGPVAKNIDLATLVYLLSTVPPGVGAGDAAIAALQAFIAAPPVGAAPLPTLSGAPGVGVQSGGTIALQAE